MYINHDCFYCLKRELKHFLSLTVRSNNTLLHSCSKFRNHYPLAALVHGNFISCYVFVLFVTPLFPTSILVDNHLRFDSLTSLFGCFSGMLVVTRLSHYSTVCFVFNILKFFLSLTCKTNNAPHCFTQLLTNL